MKNKTYDILNDYLYSRLIELIKEHENIPTFETLIRHTIQLEIIDFFDAILDLNHFINYELIYDCLSDSCIRFFEDCIRLYDEGNPCDA